MTKTDLPYLKVYQDNRRKWRYYFRHKGKSKSLPGNREVKDLNDARFLEAYTNALAEVSGEKVSERRHGPKSLGAAVTAYLADPFTFGQMAEGTQKEWRRCLEHISSVHGHRRANQMHLKHLKEIRNNLAQSPGSANNYVDALKSLCKWMLENEWRDDNPAIGLKRFDKVRSYDAWKESDIEAFLEVADDRAELALKLLLYTGQRRGDVAKMTWHDYDGQLISVVQQKTGAKLEIPCHSELKAILDAEKAKERSGITILTTAQGKSFNSNSLGLWFSKIMDKAGLRKERGLALHGLRAAAASRLDEAGCTTSEIKAITGHKSDQMVNHYTRGSRQKRRAMSAIRKLEDEK